jgi:glycosyltransferase involved in cell wall biosynthesis
LWDSAYELPKDAARALLHYIELRSLQRADRLISPGWALAKAAEHLTGKQVTTIENPYVFTCSNVDRHVYQDLLEGKEYLLFYGSIGLLKGVKTIADIIHRVLEMHPSLFFVFAGKDMTYKNGPMMDLVWNEAGAYRGRVLYLGTLPRSQLYPIIENAKAVVLPSRIDNLPNACLEAMLYGKIVVGTSGASFEQLINDGENGFLCEIDNGHSLFNAVEKALTLTMDQMQRMGAAAKKRANCLTGARAANKLTEVYREVACTCTNV